MEFKLKNPNKALTGYGLSILAIELVAYLLEKTELATLNAISLIIGVGIIVKVLVLLWVPKAASTVGRNSTGWTIICFITPTIGLILLGRLGIKYSAGLTELEQSYRSKFNEEKGVLVKEQKERAMDDFEFRSRLEQTLSDLQEQAYKEMTGIINSEEHAFLTEQLKNKGYILDEDSDVFVDVKGQCPACGAKLQEGDNSCPECELSLGGNGDS